jgi:hypothetical protein
LIVKDIIFGYGTLEPPPRLRVVEVRLDGAARPALIDQTAKRVDLFEDRAAWRRAELDLEVTADREAVGAFEVQHGELAAVAVVHCAPTMARQSARLARSRCDEARWEGTLELDRDNFRGRALLRPRLTAAVGGVAHRPVGEPAGWAVHFDEPAGLRLGGRLRVRWVDFRAEGADPLASQFADATHLVSFGAGDEPPELWLNASFEGLDGLLRDGERGGAERGVHDLLRTGIARGVWMELVAVAMAAIRAEDGGGGRAEWPEAEWQREVLRRILPRVAPGKPGRELLELAATEWRSPAGAGEFYARAEAAVGDMIRADESLRRLIQATEEGDES